MLSIREVRISDAGAVAKLSGELGYPVSIEVMENRIRTLEVLNDHVVYVACVTEGVVGCIVVGWIVVGVTHHLQAEPYGEIGGLVVSSEFRSNGIGRQLVATAERWVADRGIAKVLVRSQIAREAAHRFYLREGYSQTKTSAVFSKALG